MCVFFSFRCFCHVFLCVLRFSKFFPQIHSSGCAFKVAGQRPAAEPQIAKGKCSDAVQSSGKIASCCCYLGFFVYCIFFFSDVKGYMLDSKFSGVVFWHLHLLVWWYIKLMNSTKLHSPEDLLYVHCWLSCIGVKAVGAQVPRDWMAKRCKEPVWVWANQM